MPMDVCTGENQDHITALQGLQYPHREVWALNSREEVYNPPVQHTCFDRAIRL